MRAEGESYSMNAFVQAPTWRVLDAWPSADRPEHLWPYIAETGSLTNRLRERAGDDFHLRILNERQLPLPAADAGLLGAAAAEPAFQREVYICGLRPLVYARSIAAKSVGGERWLKDLGERPLGERVFAEKGARRSPIQAALVYPGQPLFEEAFAGMRERPPVDALWGRRSVLMADGAHILIYECFLPGLSS